MTSPVETRRTLASSFALAAFAVAVLAGLARDVDAAQILLRAIAAMIVCYGVGRIAGRMCDYAIRSQPPAKSGDGSDSSVAGASWSASSNMSSVESERAPAEPASLRTVKSRAAA
ncbi:MAG TPA: hypothetical protein VMS30_10870 [Phycisphaerales bacterium]|nr:hypothetical protein [Phycisphaerales bacterium]